MKTVNECDRCHSTDDKGCWHTNYDDYDMCHQCYIKTEIAERSYRITDKLQWWANTWQKDIDKWTQEITELTKELENDQD